MYAKRVLDMSKILVSGCLMGFECRYKNDSCRNERILELAKEHVLIPVCPEQMGGLPTPRNPAERVEDRVISSAGDDVTAEYQKGAAAALYTAQVNHVDFAILKANSPSCGKGVIYDGSFSGKKTAGNGLTAELLMKNGFAVYTEDQLDDLPL